MTTAKKLVTAEELLALPDEGKRHELVRGVLIEMPPASHEHGRVAMRFGRRVGNFVEDHNLGHDIGAETGVTIGRNPDTTLAPDYGFISYERMATSPPLRGYANVVPDLVIEVVSPNERQAGTDAKTQMWLDAGVRLVLIAYPDTKEVHAHHDDGTVQRFGVNDTMTCEPVLPGFSCPVADIFAF